MERKKERIMLMSLQRRQRADEARVRADAAAAARKAREEAAIEQKAARKEEQARRREVILQQYKLKKAIEEAEREVPVSRIHTDKQVDFKQTPNIRMIILVIDEMESKLE